MSQITPYPGTGSNGGIGPGLVVSSGDNILVFGDGFTVQNISIEVDVGSGLQVNAGQVVPVVGNGLAVVNGTITATGVASAGTIIGNSPTVGALFSVTNNSNPDPSNRLGYSIFSNDTGTLINNGANERPRWFNTDLTVNAGMTANSIHENFWSSVGIVGAGTMAAEINQFHAYFQNDMSGSITGPVEGYEASMTNNGTMSAYSSYLSQPTNGAAGVATIMKGYVSNFFNNNTTPGALAGFVHIDISVMQGSGAAPTFINAMKIADPLAAIVTLGQIAIGVLGVANANDSLRIIGRDSASSSFAISAKNASAQNTFSVSNTGQVTAMTSVTIGSSGTLAGSLFFNNATSGTIKVVPTTGALGNVVLTLPDVTDTFAVLGTSQTHTQTQTFSGTLLQSNTAVAITAHAGGGQASATQLTATHTVVNVVATSGDSVRFRVAQVGDELWVTNNSGNPMQLFGGGTDTINGNATATGVSIPAGKTGVYRCPSLGTLWGGTLN